MLSFMQMKRKLHPFKFAFHFLFICFFYYFHITCTVALMFGKWLLYSCIMLYVSNVTDTVTLYIITILNYRILRCTIYTFLYSTVSHIHFNFTALYYTEWDCTPTSQLSLRPNWSGLWVVWRLIERIAKHIPIGCASSDINWKTTVGILRGVLAP